MKSLLAVTLLLMSTLPCVESGNFAELFDLDKLTVDLPSTLGKHVSKDAARVVEVELVDKEQYLMRIDPVEKCGRVVICADANNPCDQANDAIFLNPMGDKKIYKKTSLTLTEITAKMEDDNILVEFSKTGSKVTFEFNYRTGTKVKHDFPVSAPLATHKIRIETSSFYCKVNIGTVAQKAVADFPTMKVPTTKYPNGPNTFDLEPFRTGKVEPSTGREFFGPLFRLDDDESTCPNKVLTKCDGVNEKLLKLNTGILCPHAHDWAGFSRWTEPINKVDQERYNATFFNHAVYRYGLEKSTDVTCGTLGKPFQIEIELNQVFDTKNQLNFHRCFGFALVFQPIDTSSAAPETLNLDPARTFEFYLPAMMFIAPDTEKIRSLRIRRSDLKKIRLSFYTDNTNDYAIVEYGFLNDNIPGVREHIALTKDSLLNWASKFKNSVSLFSEGYCEVRVLNARIDKTKESSEGLCMHLNGCDVFAKKEETAPAV